MLVIMLALYGLLYFLVFAGSDALVAIYIIALGTLTCWVYCGRACCRHSETSTAGAPVPIQLSADVPEDDPPAPVHGPPQLCSDVPEDAAPQADVAPEADVRVVGRGIEMLDEAFESESIHSI
eukprot:TRINITY_DN19620_c0_g1_i2.p1 TRINITY_DN19620_c0_g1~~TRINITY_DN19620_c0_g1_i2.p1  ORF type:complete len:139 (+),score=8.91 TRINITY_DN19620_c0_g1_i2:49-417(+)